MRVLLHDFGLRADGVIAAALYLAATLGSILTAVILLGMN
jgi:hypothetical protein